MRIIANRIEHAAKGDGTITFVTGDEPSTKTWAQLHDESKKLAVALQARGVSWGDHIALLGPTSVDLVTSLQAIWLCGATLVVLPLPMRLASIEEFTVATKARIASADCRAVLVDPDLVPFIEAAPDDAPLYTTAELVSESEQYNSADFIAPNYYEDDLLILQFTSGSTSQPKGVMLPNRVMAANLDAIDAAGEVDLETDTMVSWLPLYHDMGLVGFCTLPMTSGLNLVLGAPQDFLASPGRWMEWIADYGGTATAGPNFSYVLATRALRKSKRTLDLSKLRIALNGAEPVDPASVRSFIEAGERHGLRPGAVFPAFGMAEVGIAGAFPKPMSGLRTDTVDAALLELEQQAVPIDTRHQNAREMVKLGVAVPGLEFRIVDAQTGAQLEDRQVGELQIRGTSVTPGYYQREAENRMLFEDGWLKTGDLAYLVEGDMVMCGRIKDVIIVGGRNVYPQDIERVVGEIEGVRAGNVIAFGVPTNKGKESLVVVAETRSEDTESIRSQVGGASLKAVGIPCREVLLVRPGTLPKTSSGKLQRALCKKQYLEERLEPVA